MIRRIGLLHSKELPHVARRSKSCGHSHRTRRFGNVEQRTAQQHESHAERTALEPRQSAVHQVVLNKITPVNQTIKLFQLRLTEGSESSLQATQFLPGQWVDLFIPGLSSPGGFTITSSPLSAQSSSNEPAISNSITPEPVHNGIPHVELAVQSSPNPPAQWLFRPPDDILNTTLHIRPGGSFHYPPLDIEPGRFLEVQRVLMVAGGVGINPLMAMLRSLKSDGPHITLLYAVRKPPLVEGGFLDERGAPRSGILFFEDLIALALRIPQRISMSFYLTGDRELAGHRKALKRAVSKGNVEVFEGTRWTHEELEKALGEQRARDDTAAYVCGPPQMTDEVVEVLKRAQGMKEDWVFCEKWW